ncbi:MaoC/PaaZ C-terminal domain-containing protein [Kurthia sibirica]|uniref:MaoC/PaaZ C-terminal domain-containing protein n=1 Tax=Kurthia sibirica TaxID=202750 RepID=UPI001169FD1B|nr:MaoC/PaaZ C-terminal domain-containing protein [Kurthia sibirica]GEK35379.1 enoyl-CoA hydratase [Kurthia sibirica]
MLLGKNYKLGKTFDDIDIGNSLQITENIEDKDLLLYLGLTNDNNPLYIQHDYAALTKYEKPVVPAIMLNGIVTSAVSKYLPGPGAFITSQRLSYPQPLYHYETIQIKFTVINKLPETSELQIKIEGRNTEGADVIMGEIYVVPPKKPIID